MSETVESALVAADWWAGRTAIQPEHEVTNTMRVLADEVRRLQAILAECEASRV